MGADDYLCKPFLPREVTSFSVSGRFSGLLLDSTAVSSDRRVSTDSESNNSAPNDRSNRTTDRRTHGLTGEETRPTNQQGQALLNKGRQRSGLQGRLKQGEGLPGRFEP